MSHSTGAGPLTLYVAHRAAARATEECLLVREVNAAVIHLQGVAETHERARGCRKAAVCVIVIMVSGIVH